MPTPSCFLEGVLAFTPTVDSSVCLHVYQSVLFFFLEANYFTMLEWFCHTLTCVSHGCSCVPHPELPSHLPPHPIPQGHASAPAPSTLSHASNLAWRSVSHIIYMFQCYSPKSFHLRLLPQSPKVCSLNLCLFCCLTFIYFRKFKFIQ